MTGKKVVKDGKSKNGSLSRAETSLVMHRLVICGRATTVRLEDEMWASFKDIAQREGCSLQELGSHIYREKKGDKNFGSAIRVFLPLYYRDAAIEADRAKDTGAGGSSF